MRMKDEGHRKHKFSLNDWDTIVGTFLATLLGTVGSGLVLRLTTEMIPALTPIEHVALALAATIVYVGLAAAALVAYHGKNRLRPARAPTQRRRQ